MGSRAAQSVSSAVVQTAFSPPIWDPWAHRRRTGPRGRAARWAPGLAPRGVRAADALLPDAEQLREPPARSPRTPLLGAQCRATGRGGKWRPRCQGVFLLGRARCPEHVQPSFLPKQSPLRGVCGLKPRGGGFQEERDCARAVNRCPSRSAPSTWRLHGQPSTCWLTGTPGASLQIPGQPQPAGRHTQERPAQAWATSPAQRLPHCSFLGHPAALPDTRILLEASRRQGQPPPPL